MAVGKFSPVSALTPHERLRLRAQLDAIIATLYGLSREDYAWILKDCDHPAEKLSSKEFCRQLDAKGFWRVDKDQPPHLRHPVLSFAAFVALEQQIAISGSRDSGIAAFCAQNDGDGWMLPETLCIATLKMTRTVNAGSYDAEASVEQPVASALGPRFLDWQLAQSVEESWAECERHARVILGGEVGQIQDVVKTTEVEKVAEKGKEEKVVVKQQRLF